MRDPVVLRGDGCSYERSAIAAWLKKLGTSPVTGAPLHGPGQKALVPNHLLRNIIQAAAQQVGQLRECGEHC